jgi:hypothetical protein
MCCTLVLFDGLLNRCKPWMQVGCGRLGHLVSAMLNEQKETVGLNNVSVPVRAERSVIRQGWLTGGTGACPPRY